MGKMLNFERSIIAAAIYIQTDVESNESMFYNYLLTQHPLNIYIYKKYIHILEKVTNTPYLLTLI